MSSKFVYVRNNIMTNIIKHCRGEKNRGPRAIDEFRKKLFIPDHEISESIEHKVKSKIETIFVNEDTDEEYFVRIYEIDPYFSEHYKKRIQVDNKDQQYILFRIDIYFTKYRLAVEIDEKGHTDRNSKFKKLRRKTLKKEPFCKFIRINTSKENFNINEVSITEVSRIQVFISQFKDNEIKERDSKRKEKDKKNKELEDEIKEKDNEIKEENNKNKQLEDEIKEKDNEIKERDNQIKEKEDKNKELEDEIKKLKLKLANLGIKNNDVNDKK